MIQLLKNIYVLVRSVWSKIDKVLVILFYRNSFLSTIYYSIFSTSFYREHKAVLAGRARYIQDSKSKESNYYRLVRNIHRIEKGLLMRPRRPVFAKDYIKETIDSFEGVWLNHKERKNPQLKWFYDVLNEYFIIVDSEIIINSQKKRFYDIIDQNQVDNLNGSKSIPYNRAVNSSITYDDFIKLVRQRRSVRWFLDKKVPRDKIDKAILAASQAPSACNRQPFTYKVIDDPDLFGKFVNLPMGTAGYSHSIQTFVIIIGNLDAYYDERDRHVIYIDASLANMNFMLALETLGLSSCSINWPDIERKEKRMDNLLSLKPYQRPIMCIGVGYPDPEGKVAYSEKRSLTNLRSYNI